jgi:hypothetical protein
MYAFAVPIPAGKTEAARQFTETCLGARKAEYDDMQRRSGVTDESYWLQESPEGDVMIVVSDSDQTGFEQIMANPQTEFDRWYREQIKDVFGVDPGEPWGERNRMIGHWQR